MLQALSFSFGDFFFYRIYGADMRHSYRGIHEGM